MANPYEEDVGMNDSIQVSDFCIWGCGMLGVQHTEGDELCAQRREQRYDRPNCALIYVPVWLAELKIAEGRAPRECFLTRTPDGYLPLRVRITPTPDGGAVCEIGVTDDVTDN